mmetsp:Transcript_41418/g.65632  ORF Transcript_41418/g.65632 Transcript_41418/m.65632 type:complete len:120 (+) Transcript_41418:93-452(+)
MAKFFIAFCAAVVSIASASSLVHSKALRTSEDRLALTSAKKLQDEPKAVDLSKKMPLKAQEQGFEGKKVQHKDQKTSIGDWQNEYGHEKEKEALPLTKSSSIRSALSMAALLVIAASLQ